MTDQYPAHRDDYLANYCFDTLFRSSYYYLSLLRSLTIKAVKEAERESLKWNGMDEYLEQYQSEDYEEIPGLGEVCKTLGVPLEEVGDVGLEAVVGRLKERR